MPNFVRFFSLFCQKSECVPVQTGTEFALHYDIDSFLKKELNFMKKTHLLYIRPYNDLLVSCSWFMIKSEEIS